MKCDVIPLIELLHGRLNAVRVENLLTHLEECTHCRECVRTAAALMAAQRGKLPPKRRLGLPAASLW